MPHQISLTLNVEETNTVLEALGQLPYVRVHALIQKVQQQATEQLSGTRDDDRARPEDG
ncbi:hypothetical protein [Actinophytocola oryzae]|uniref:Uncharacterized protein n=1 Tax=Actinophytocola oryzae TaxID=502181 RepID=A0A4R7W0C4_9PSEU|nr:hypothetical protein [Actinophytocola oryzae]TDV55950.1 hypothetical protein CLV71_10211 [Actinophytocola oryzae]